MEIVIELIMFLCYYLGAVFSAPYAKVAQSVEHFTRNEGVVGSSPIFSFKALTNNQGFFIL